MMASHSGVLILVTHHSSLITHQDNSFQHSLQLQLSSQIILQLSFYNLHSNNRFQLLDLAEYLLINQFFLSTTSTCHHYHNLDNHNTLTPVTTITTNLTTPIIPTTIPNQL